MADSGYRRKELLHWLKKVEGLDFVIRIEGSTVRVAWLKSARTWLAALPAKDPRTHALKARLDSLEKTR